jgi:hypothetical protein
VFPKKINGANRDGVPAGLRLLVRLRGMAQQAGMLK